MNPPNGSANKPVAQNEQSSACHFLSISCHAKAHPIQTVSVLGLLIALVVCWRRRRGLRGYMGLGDQTRGEYRAVAAHYTANGFDDTFDDDVSFSDFDDDDGGGFDEKHHQVVELKDLDNVRPSLEEING
jgi:hypothetical protein